MATVTYDWATTLSSFLVNTSWTTGNQGKPSIIADGPDRFSIFYDHPPESAVRYATFYNADGSQYGLSGNFKLFVTNAISSSADAVSLAGGGQAWVYQDTNLDPGGDVRGVVFERSAGGFLTNAIDVPVSAVSQFSDSQPSVGALADGGFVASWTRIGAGGSLNIMSKVHEANGSFRTGAIAVEAGAGVLAVGSSVAGLAGGGYAVAWQQTTTLDPNSEVRFRRFDSNGNPLDGSSVLIDTVGSINRDIQVAGLADGGFAVAYADNGWSVSGTEITFRIYNADGSARTTFIRANTGTAGDQEKPTITLLSNGFIAVGWTSSADAFIQTYAPDGQAIGTNFVAAGGGTISSEIAGLGGGLLGMVRESSTPDAGGDASIRASVHALVRTTTGDATNEWLYGDDLIDSIQGAGGGDLIFGEGGGDTLTGGAGGDFIDGGAGADQLSGGLDFDTVSWFSESAAVTVNLINQTLNGGAAAGDQVGGFEAYYLTQFADTFTNGANGGYVYGFAGNDTIIGGSGSDFIDGGAGSDTIAGSDGFDYASYASEVSAAIIDLSNQNGNGGSAFGDRFVAMEAFYLTAYGDIFTGQSGQNFVFAGDGGDSLNASTGSASNDWLFGQAGNDTLRGGSLDDLLSGGDGADQYVFSVTDGGFDSILDFTPGVDKIAFKAASSGFGQGPLPPEHFIAAASPFATGPGAAVLYATGLGIIYLDPDGSGAQAAIAIAQIAGAPTLTAGDFLFVP